MRAVQGHQMRLFIGKPTDPQETRIPVLLIEVGKSIQLGAQVEVRSGIGEFTDIPDAECEGAGAQAFGDRGASLPGAAVLQDCQAWGRLRLLSRTMSRRACSLRAAIHLRSKSGS